MNYRDWHAGMRVVCVRTQEVERARDEGVILPTIGRVYTIRDIEPSDGWTGVCIRLNEIRNKPHFEDGLEPSFYHGWFRPLDESSLDIFRAHLAPSPKQKERA
ncbi:MAG: hypothetical protein ACTHJQ_01455 [Rhizobiaceae bacterium]